MSRTKEMVEQMIEEYNSEHILYETLCGIVEVEDKKYNDQECDNSLNYYNNIQLMSL